MSPREYADCFFSFKLALEELLIYPIDLVKIHSICDPYFWKFIQLNLVGFIYYFRFVNTDRISN